MKRKYFAIAAILVVLIAGLMSSCASVGPMVSKAERKQKEEEFNLKFLQASEKWLPWVYRVAYRLITSPVPDHSSKEPEFWFAGVGVNDLKEYARKAYGIDKKVSGVLVLEIYPGSKAEYVDLKLGDVIEKVNGKKTKNLGAYFKAIRKSEQPVAKAKVLRKAERFDIEIPLEKVFYKAQFFLEPTPNLDASAMFSRINVGIGAIRYCRNDDELAVLMGHELAHTTLKHSLKKTGASMTSAIGFGIAAAAIDAVSLPGVGGLALKPVQMATDAAVSRRYEREADYFGMKHAFHSGHDVENGSRVFSRLATDAPSFSVLAQTFAAHPVTSERFLRLEKMVEEFKTNFPSKFPLQKSVDWEIIIPVQAGETQEEALERLLKEKGVEVSKSLLTVDINQKAESKPSTQDRVVVTTGTKPSTPVSITLVKTALPPAQPVIGLQPSDQVGGKVAAMTSGIGTASPASLDKDPASAYPEPKKL